MKLNLQTSHVTSEEVTNKQGLETACLQIPWASTSQQRIAKGQKKKIATESYQEQPFRLQQSNSKNLNNRNCPIAKESNIANFKQHTRNHTKTHIQSEK